MTSGVLVESVIQRIKELLLRNVSLTPYCCLNMYSVNVVFQGPYCRRQLVTSVNVVTFCHMFAEEMPSYLRKAHNLNGFWCIGSADKSCQHRDQVVGYIGDF